jgi:hypothetical protein
MCWVAVAWLLAGVVVMGYFAGSYLASPLNPLRSELQIGFVTAALLSSPAALGCLLFGLRPPSGSSPLTRRLCLGLCAGWAALLALNAAFA